MGSRARTRAETLGKIFISVHKKWLMLVRLLAYEKQKIAGESVKDREDW